MRENNAEMFLGENYLAQFDSIFSGEFFQRTFKKKLLELLNKYLVWKYYSESFASIYDSISFLLTISFRKQVKLEKFNLSKSKKSVKSI